MSFDFKPKHFKPRSLNDSMPFSLKKLDNETIKLQVPVRISGIPVKNILKDQHRTHICFICRLPTVWYNCRIKEMQYNMCVHCDQVHAAKMSGFGRPKIKMVREFPLGYQKPLLVKDKRGKTMRFGVGGIV